MTPFVRASLIAPFTAPLLYCVASLAVAVADPVRRGSAGQNLVGGVALVFAFGAPVAFAAMLGELVSVPLAPWHGGVLGAAAAAVWWWLASPPRQESR